MKLTPIQPQNPVFKARCLGCRQVFLSTHLWADLDGEPYVDYYCDDCVEELPESDFAIGVSDEANAARWPV